MIIVSWNCKGLGNPLKVEAVKDLIKRASLDILLLQETKIEEENILSLSKTNWKKEHMEGSKCMGLLWWTCNPMVRGYVLYGKLF